VSEANICPATGRVCGVTGCMGGRCLYPGVDLTPPALPPHQLGWQCPKCGRGNAPWKASCECGPAFYVNATNSTKVSP
jgi:hypothetical protein